MSTERTVLFFLTTASSGFRHVLTWASGARAWPCLSVESEQKGRFSANDDETEMSINATLFIIMPRLMVDYGFY
jgi:hypothetical protein